jgi:NitT/TauT family transport system substrate-binding protein
MGSSTGIMADRLGSTTGRPLPRLVLVRHVVMTFLLAMLLPAACQTSAAPERLKLRIGISQWPGFDVFYHARQRGLFEKRGLDVQLMKFDNQQDAARAAVLGSLDAAFVAAWDMLQVVPGNDSPAMFLVTNISYGADGIVARPGITSMAELRGKRVAAKVAAVNHLILSEALALHRIGANEIELVDIDNAVAERQMYEGSVDAATIWEPALSQIAARTGGSILYTTREIDSAVVDGLITSKQTIAARREALIRLILVWFDVMHALEREPDQVYADAGAAIGVDAATFARSYAGVKKGDRALNRRMFIEGGLRHALVTAVEVLRHSPASHPPRTDAIAPELLAAALERWRPLPEPGSTASR